MPVGETQGCVGGEGCGGGESAGGQGKVTMCTDRGMALSQERGHHRPPGVHPGEWGLSNCP